MATSIWLGAGGTGGHPRSGAFEDGANWANGATPAQDDDVVFASGRYVVTLSQSAYEIGALNLGSGVTLACFSTSSTLAYLSLTKDSTSNGLIDLNSSGIVVDASAAPARNPAAVRGHCM